MSLEQGRARLGAADGAALLCLMALAIVLVQGLGLAGQSGSAIIGDFTVFWTAGHAAATGDALRVYDAPWFLDLAGRLMGRPVPDGLVWRNPPSFLFVVQPFALLPYGWAWLAWILASAAGFILAIRCVTADWRIVLLALLAPASLFCAMLGQNGFLTAMLAGLAMCWIDRRPVAAGLCLALLTYKPQFGAVLPLLLLLSRRWITFAAAGIGTVALMALTEWRFGPGIWLAFLASLSDGVAAVSGEGGTTFYYHAIQTALRSAGAPAALAWGGHAVVAIAAFAIAARFWWRGPAADEDLRAVATFGAMMLVTPFVFIYDQVLLGMAVAFLSRAARRGGGWLPGEAPLAVAACLLPGLALVAKAFFLGPLAWIILLALVMRRDAARAAR